MYRKIINKLEERLKDLFFNISAGIKQALPEKFIRFSGQAFYKSLEFEGKK